MKLLSCRLLCLGICTWWGAGPALAQAAGIQAQLEPQHGSLETPLRLTVVVEGSQTATPNLPDLSMFEVQSQGRASNVQIRNGQVSSSVTYHFTLLPQRPGQFHLKPCSVQIDGKTYYSEALQVQIDSHAPPPAASPDNAAAPAPAGLSISANVSDTTPYVGQQIVYTWRFQRRERIGSANLTLPDFSDFVVEPMGERREYESVHDGQRFTITEIRKALFASDSGAKTLQGSSLQCEVFSPSTTPDAWDDFSGLGGAFGAFFNHGQRRMQLLRSPPLQLNVQPLPAAPADHSDLVGTFTLHSQLSQTHLSVGDSTTLTVTLSGTGNLQQALEPHMAGLEAFKTYDDKPRLSSRVGHDALVSTKVFQKALVPRVAGVHTLPPMHLVYFDPHQRRYVTASSTALQLHVQAAANAPPDSSAASARAAPPYPGATAPLQSAVEVLGDDIGPLYTRADVLLASRRAAPWAWWLIYTLPVGLFGLAGGLYCYCHPAASQQRQRQRALAWRRAQQDMPHLQRLLREQAWSAAAQHAAQTLRHCLGLALQQEGGALTAAEAHGQLTARGVSPKLVEQIDSLLDDCAAAQYSGMPQANLTSLPQRLQQVLSALQKAVS